jgi:sirohydrochlorin cobaltochelatase
MKKGIIVASFGTSYKDTRKNCIESIENKIKGKFADYEVVRAFTSNMVIKRIKEKESVETYTVETAIEAMSAQGIKKIYIQPLHIIPGFEYHKIRRAVSLANHKADMEVILGTPLLNEEEHYDEVVAALEERLPKSASDQGMILMGHGTEHPANACYSMLQMKLNDVRSDIHIANVEGYPELDHILSRVEGYKKLTLMPLMIVAGDHAQNDMAGDEEDSYKSILSEMGIETECILEGLGQNPAIQDIFVNRLADLLEA